MEKLRELFSGYAAFPPTAFVLCGHFLTCPAGEGHIKALKGNHTSFVSYGILLVYGNGGGLLGGMKALKVNHTSFVSYGILLVCGNWVGGGGE